MADLLTDDRVRDELDDLHGWALVGDGIERRFEFADFVAAFGFMASCAIVAESMHHHPEWSNVYRTVSVRLTTHDAGGVTELDIALARRMNELAATTA